MTRLEVATDGTAGVLTVTSDDVDHAAIRDAIAARYVIDVPWNSTCDECECVKCSAQRLLREAGYISFFAGSYVPPGTTLEFNG
jgi:hypothetical protein